LNSGRRTALFLLSSLVLFAIQWQEIRDLIKYALDTEHTNASQVVLIPFISGFLIFRDRLRIFSHVQSAVFAGILIALLGLALAAAGHFWWAPVDEGNRLALTTSSILAMWIGLFVGFYGLETFRVALFPLLFLAFCIPIPSVILNPLITLLQRGSAEITLILLRLSGTLVYREGFFFFMPGFSIEVAKECSGIRSCLSMLILTILAGHILLETTWRRLVLIVVAIPIMIFKNAVRIVTLTLLSMHVDPAILQSRLHREGGIPFFLLALLLTYPILKLLMKAERREKLERIEKDDAGGQSMLREANL
jgi:exosortase